MDLGDGLKKLLLAGIGTVAVTAEKSKEILDELVKKREISQSSRQGPQSGAKAQCGRKPLRKMLQKVSTEASPIRRTEGFFKMTPEQLASLKEQILKMEEEKEAF